MENMQEMLNNLGQALYWTRAEQNIVGLSYDEKKEIVKVHYINSTMDVNVACDSGVQMMIDVLEAIK